ncbi:ABC-2 family transporter protein [Gracilinema caldarium]|uniref:ABC transporter permease n=1 Tax=Gracilinema caldarium TaxID=215591 RepID=UPI0026EA648E|nr:ABC-2 family transporter protein [Gracilinema caldarium]
MRFKAYTPFTSAGIQSAIAYKWNFLGFFFGQIFFTFVMFFLWRAVFRYTPGGLIGGFTFLDMTLYIFAANITGFLTDTDASYVVGEEIVQGTIAMRLIKPVSFNLSILFTELGQKLIIISMVALPVFAGLEWYRFTQSGFIQFSLPTFLFYMISAGLSYLVMFFFDVCFGYLAFVFKNLWGINILKFGLLNFLSGGMIPLAFFPPMVQRVMGFLPFASMRYTPVMIYTEKYQGLMILSAMGTQILWVLLLYGLSRLIWKLTEQHLTVQGG